MESRAAVEAVAALAAISGDANSPRDADPLRSLVDGCLDGLAEVARLEARTAALKAKLAADYVRTAKALARPAASPQDRTAHELALIAEPSIARQLITDGAESFHRVLTDPRDGAPLEIGRTSYRLTKAQRQWLRDGKCPYPGCNNHSQDNEADHLLAWAHGGTTGISNLAQPCPKHHRLKHRTAWTPTTASKNQPP